MFSHSINWFHVTVQWSIGPLYTTVSGLFLTHPVINSKDIGLKVKVHIYSIIIDINILCISISCGGWKYAQKISFPDKLPKDIEILFNLSRLRVANGLKLFSNTLETRYIHWRCIAKYGVSWDIYCRCIKEPKRLIFGTLSQVSVIGNRVPVE